MKGSSDRSFAYHFPILDVRIVLPPPFLRSYEVVIRGPSRTGVEDVAKETSRRGRARPWRGFRSNPITAPLVSFLNLSAARRRRRPSSKTACCRGARIAPREPDERPVETRRRRRLQLDARPRASVNWNGCSNWNNKRNKQKLRQPRIELGAQRWQRWILPLNHWR